MKKIDVVIDVVYELVFIVLDYNTWKKELKKEISKGVDKWGDENKIEIVNDINKLREKNIETVLMIADEIDNSFNEEKNMMQRIVLKM